MEKPTVVFILDSFGFPNGMASTQRVKMIAQSLSESGFIVHILCVRAIDKEGIVINTEVKGCWNNINYEYTAGITMRSNKFWIRRYFDIRGLWVAIRRLSMLRKEHRLICVYYYGNILHNTFNRWFLYYVAKILRVPITTDISEPPWLILRSPKWYDRFLTPLKGLNGVIVISHSLKEWVEKAIEKDQVDLKVLKLPVLINEHEFPSSLKLNMLNDPYVLFSGSSNYDTTFDFIFQAMEIVWKSNSKCKLVITGFAKGSLEERRLIQKINQLAFPDLVVLTGYLPRIELFNWYSSSKALLVPLFDDLRSTMRFPTKIAEYCMAGRPIITTSVGEIPIFFNNGIEALICTPGDIEEFAQRIIDSITPVNFQRMDTIGKNAYIKGKRCFDIAQHRELISNYFLDLCRSNKT